MTHTKALLGFKLISLAFLSHSFGQKTPEFASTLSQQSVYGSMFSRDEKPSQLQSTSLGRKLATSEPRRTARCDLDDVPGFTLIAREWCVSRSSTRRQRQRPQCILDCSKACARNPQCTGFEYTQGINICEHEFEDNIPTHGGSRLRNTARCYRRARPQPQPLPLIRPLVKPRPNNQQIQSLIQPLVRPQIQTVSNTRETRPTVAVQPTRPLAQAQPQIQPTIAVDPVPTVVTPQTKPLIQRVHTVAVQPTRPLVQPQIEIAVDPVPTVVTPQTKPQIQPVPTIAVQPTRPLLQPQIQPTIAVDPVPAVGEVQTTPQIQPVPTVAVQPTRPLVQPQIQPIIAVDPVPTVGEVQAKPQIQPVPTIAIQPVVQVDPVEELQEQLQDLPEATVGELQELQNQPSEPVHFGRQTVDPLEQFDVRNL